MRRDRSALHLLAFVIIGTGLFLAERVARPRAAAPSSPSRAVIRIARATVAGLRHDWALQTGRLPTQSELALLIEQAADDEMLYREALRLGLDRHDSVVRRRLVQNMRFVSADPRTGATSLYRDALALGMDRSDLVVRRRLIERLLLLVGAEAYARPPSAAELQAYFAQHRDQFLQPARVKLSQIFLSRQRRGARLAADAGRLLRRIAAAAPSAATGLGDPLPLPRDLPLESQPQLGKLFGPDFAAAAMAAAPGRWSGPVPSSYGLHLIFVHERVAPRPLTLPDVRDRVRDALLAERAEERRAAFRQRLRQRYEVRVEPSP